VKEPSSSPWWRGTPGR